MKLPILTVLLLCVCSQSAAGEIVEWSLSVEGVARSTWVYLPAEANKNPAEPKDHASNAIQYPVVFAFHGHGGNARNAQRTFQIEKHWPDAIVVYMQGIPTPGQLTDPEGKKNGWQSSPGDQNDRDLKFFDAVYEKLLKEYSIAKNKVFCTGHSNGGGFCYLLCSTRGDRFAAIAPSASAAGRRIPDFKPMPLLHIAGTNDALVKFAWQERSIERAVELNQCERESVKSSSAIWSVYRSSKAPVFTYIHDGTHSFPKEAPKIIAHFFQSEPWKLKENRKE